MNRRQFLLGSTSMIAAAALPAAPVQTDADLIGIDLASGQDMSALWIIESNPTGSKNWCYRAFFNAAAMKREFVVPEWTPVLAES